jgi:hypothetical protein
MTRGIQQDPYSRLRLTLRQPHSKSHCAIYLSYQTNNLEIQVQHHLLLTRAPKPHGTYVVRVVMLT